jgi:hypothetical protein
VVEAVRRATRVDRTDWRARRAMALRYAALYRRETAAVLGVRLRAWWLGWRDEVRPASGHRAAGLAVAPPVLDEARSRAPSFRRVSAPASRRRASPSAAERAAPRE